MWAVKREKDGEIIAMCSTLKDAEAMACKDLNHGIHYTIEEMEDGPEIREVYRSVYKTRI
jgi:hypothetical protein